MSPELADLFSLRNLLLYGTALFVVVLVSLARANRERATQRLEGKPLSSRTDMGWDVLYGSLAAMCLLLIQDALKPLPIKLALGASMFYGYLGPSAWDLVASLRIGGITFKPPGGKGDDDHA